MSEQSSKPKKAEEKITSASSPEEIADFFSKTLKISEKVQLNIKKEEISGDILLSLDDKELESLELKLGPRKRVKKYLEENKSDFPEKEIDVKINIKSTEEEVKNFLEKYFGIKEDLGLDGKTLLELTNDDIGELGLKLGKKKRLIKYLKYFKSLKVEEKKEEEKKEEEKKVEENKEENKKEDMNEQEEKKDEKIDEQNKDEENNKDINKKEEDNEIKEKEWTAKLEVIDEKKLRQERCKPLNLESKFNIFFMLSLTNNYNDEIFSIVICNGEKGEKYVEYPYNIISDEDTTALDQEIRRIILIQVASEEKIKNIYVKILKKEKELIKEEIILDENVDKKEKDKNEIITGEEKEKKDENINKEENKEKKEGVEEKKEEKKVNEEKDKENKEDKNEDKEKEENKEEINQEIKEESKKEPSEEKGGEKEKDKNEEKEKNKDIAKKEVKIEIKEKIKITEFICKININEEIDNYFHFSNLLFENLSDNIIFEENIDFIFEIYITFFLNESFISKKNFKKDIIQSLLYTISLIKKQKEISLSLNNLFYIFKSCLEFNLQINNISSINFVEDINNIQKENILSSDELDTLYTLFKEKQEKNIENVIKKYASFIIKFYSSNIEYKTLLKGFLDSKNIKYYIRDIFTLLIQEEIKISDLDLVDAEDKKEKINKVKKEFLEVSNTKEEINFILNKFSKGLIEYLQFIQENIDLICNILDKSANKKKKNKNKKEEMNYYILNLPAPDKEDDINQIYELIKDTIFKMQKNARKYNILNFEQIFNQLVDIYANETLDELCNLRQFKELLQKHLSKDTLENYYIKIHQKGMNLIKMGEMYDTNEIISFIYEKDEFYKNKLYINNENRDPSIFEFIPIGNMYQNHQYNIDVLKEKQIWKLFEESKGVVINAFHKIFLDQVLNINDLESLLDLFPDKEINKFFITDINNKFNEVIYTCFNEGKGNMRNERLFKLFEHILILNHNNGLSELDQIKLISTNFDDLFTSDYFFYLLKSEKVKKIIPKVKDYIINFFIDQHKKGNTSIDSLILLLKASPDESFRIELLNQMDNFLLDEKDFYQREETKKFKLFKFFNQNFKDLIKKGGKNLKGKYLIKSVELKKKIEKDLNEGNVPYITIDTLLQYEYQFLEKIKVLVDFNTNEANKILNKIKSMVNKCLSKFEVFDKFIEYYSTFFKQSKRDLIQLIKNKLNLTKEQHLIHLINLNQDKYIVDENFSFNDCLNDNEYLKYKYSIFFMPIYREKYENEHLEKTEEEIFNGTIKVFKDSFTKIINQRETKEPFFEIMYVEIILRTFQYYQNDKDILNKEINFLANELKNINKNAYIKNNLLSDIRKFSYKITIDNLIAGILYFINTFNKIKPIEVSNFSKTLKETHDIIIKSTVTADEIQEAMKLLNKYDYDVSSGKTSLMEFYEILLDKEEAITFLKDLKDKNMDIKTFNEFIDEQENSQLTTNDVDNLLDTFEFFKKLIENPKIISDITLMENFKISCEKEKNIMIKMKEYLKCYGELIELNKVLMKNPEATAKKVEKILKSSEVVFYKNANNNNLYTFKIVYLYQNNVKKDIDVNELNELRYKIYMSGTGSNLITEENKKEESKEVLTNKYVNLIDNINQLNNTLNSLIKSGYPFIKEFSLNIENGIAFKPKDKNKTLEKIIEEYKAENKNFKKIIKRGYESSPILRLFYAYQFIQLHEQIMLYQKIKEEEKYFEEPDKKIKSLINYMLNNQIMEYDVKYDFQKKSDCIFNINKYFELLLKENDINLDKIYSINQVLNTIGLAPGLYRSIKEGNYSDLSVDLIYLYLNLTGNFPIVNTLLFCNEETRVEEVKAFLYRALYCEKPILFVITNMEFLGLSATQNVLRTLKKIYKLRRKDIKSYLIFIYE